MLTVFGSAHLYLWKRWVADQGFSKNVRRAIAGVVLFIGVSLFLSWRWLPHGLLRPLIWVGFGWLGILFFGVLALLLGEIPRLTAFVLARWGKAGPLQEPARRKTFSRVLSLGAAAGAVGTSAKATANALFPIPLKPVEVGIKGLPKASDGMRIVQISDVHVGRIIRKDFIASVVAAINGAKPDVVVITGDLVDGDVEDLAPHVAPLADIKAKLGVFFVSGNHEYYSGAEQWFQHLPSLGIRVLRNEAVTVGGIELVGIDDLSSYYFAQRGRGGIAEPHLVEPYWRHLERALASCKTALPRVLLAHQPRVMKHAKSLGISLQLSGHTHGGQLYPLGFLAMLQQPVLAGLAKFEDFQIYVSRGTGFIGPPMRLGADPEITLLTLRAS